MKAWNDWQDIATAPLDGTLVELRDHKNGPDGPCLLMRWDAEMTNGLFPGIKGFWTAENRSFTWDHRRGYGPTQWRLPAGQA